MAEEKKIHIEIGTISIKDKSCWFTVIDVNTNLPFQNLVCNDFEAVQTSCGKSELIIQVTEILPGLYNVIFHSLPCGIMITDESIKIYNIREISFKEYN